MTPTGNPVPDRTTLLEEQRKLLILHPTVFTDSEQAVYELRQQKIEKLRLQLDLRSP